MITTPAFPIAGSPDYYIRITREELDGLVWCHAYSQSTAPDHSEGVTEWNATVRGIAASLSWSWTRLADGRISATEPRLVLSNLMLTDTKGYDFGPDDMSRALVHIASQLHWEKAVIRIIYPKEGRQYH